MSKQTMNIGVIGCGNISGIYLKRLAELPGVHVAAVSDLDADKARSRAAEFGVGRVCSVDELLADPDIDAVLNLTVPGAHGPVAVRALAAGKHVYNEKPLALSREDGRRMLQTADEKGLRVGAAPDTFLGAGIQTCRKLIDDGEIGRPVGATAFMLCHGHESWHPSPEFYYQPGGGPLFDMGPYYLTALIALIGPVRRVSGSCGISFAQRTITSEPKRGSVIEVKTPTHIAGVLDFSNGAIGTIVTSFDVWAAEHPCIEIYGSEGTISVPDPNGFGGKVRVRRMGEGSWREVPHIDGFADNMRGLGLADMAAGIRQKRPHRADGRLAYHVLDIMHGILDASAGGRHVELESACERPEPFREEALAEFRRC